MPPKKKLGKNPVPRRTYNLRPRTRRPPRDPPVMLGNLFANAPIQTMIMANGNFDRYDILRLERGGVRAGVSEEILRQYYTGPEHRCDCILNFAIHPRNTMVAGVGQCPNTNVTCNRVKLCEGSLRHYGQPRYWDHKQSLQFGGLYDILVPFRSNKKHPPLTGRFGVPFRVCVQCLHDAEYGYLDPPNQQRRKNITDSWVPFCKRHSLDVYEILQTSFTPQVQGMILCRCVADINRGWACAAHRWTTLSAIQARARHHKEWLLQMHLHRPRSPRVGTDFENYNQRKRKERLNGHTRHRWEKGNEKYPRKWPGCPAYGCGKPSWRNPNALERMAKCLGCGGMQPCAGELGDLIPR